MCFRWEMGWNHIPYPSTAPSCTFALFRRFHFFGGRGGAWVYTRLLTPCKKTKRQNYLTPELDWLVVSNIFYVHPYLGKIPILTNIFQMGWNHQPVDDVSYIVLCHFHQHHPYAPGMEQLPTWMFIDLSHSWCGTYFLHGLHVAFRVDSDGTPGIGSFVDRKESVS